MAITQAVSTNFKVELLQGLHNFTTTTGNSFKIALYLGTATMSASSPATYTATGEVSSSGTGYTTGGNTLTIETSPTSPGTSGTTAWADFQNTTWSTSTITAGGALIYNATNGNRSVVVLSFSGDKTSSAGDFTILFPAPDATNAIIRIV